MVEYKFYNPKTDFFSAIKVECDSLPREFRLFGSHQNLPTDWEEVSFHIARNPDGILLMLKIPVNYSCFQIQITGEPVPFHRISSGTLLSFTVEQIREHLKQSSLAILCCARDCEKEVGNSLQQLRNLGELFGNYQMYVMENDSKDQTFEMLKQDAGKGRLKIHTTKGLDEVFRSRTERLSYCRNYLLDASKEMEYDYYVVADLDGVFKEIREDSFLSCFKYECWVGCFPVSKNKYYDLWALRHPYLMPGDYDRRMNQLPNALGNENAQRLIAVPLRNIDFSISKGWLEVESAFGGLGLYKGAAYRQARYSGHDKDQEICEHVILHKAMRSEQSRLYINPEFILS